MCKQLFTLDSLKKIFPLLKPKTFILGQAVAEVPRVFLTLKRVFIVYLNNYKSW